MTRSDMEEIEHYTTLINDAKDQIRRNLELLAEYADRLAVVANRAQKDYR